MRDKGRLLPKAISEVIEQPMTGMRSSVAQVESTIFGNQRAAKCL